MNCERSLGTRMFPFLKVVYRNGKQRSVRLKQDHCTLRCVKTYMHSSKSMFVKCLVYSAIFPIIQPKSYKVPTVNKSLIRNYQEIIGNIEQGPNAETFAQVVDARPE